MASPLRLRPASTTSTRLHDFYVLTKPEVNLLVLMTTAAGYVLALRGAFIPATFVHLLIGTLLVASGTATLNQVMEKSHDAQMRRTAKRPLPSGRLQVREATWFGVLVSILGALDLVLFVNGLSAALAVATLLMYLSLYTPLKRKSALCTAVGAVPGAMPVLIGWAAADHLNARAYLLFTFLFLWQFPHFLAIALMYREDYERAGYKMLPARDTTGRFTRFEIVGMAVALTITVFSYVFLQPWTPAVLVFAIATAAFVLFYGLRAAMNASRVAASRLLHATVVYLPAVLILLISQKY